MRKSCLLFALLLISVLGSAQLAYRMNADILTRTRLPDSTFQVSKGKIYYDQNFKKIIFNFTFPRKECVVLSDTTTYQFINDTLASTNTNFLIPEHSYFHYILTGNISNYGFNQSQFVIGNTEKKNGSILTTWYPPQMLEEFLSEIIVETRNKLLYSVTMYNPEGNPMTRQILKKYEIIDGIEIPHEVLVATYLTKGTIYQIITLSNVQLNENGNDQKYNHEL